MDRLFSLAAAVAVATCLLAVSFGPGAAAAAPAECDDMEDYETREAYEDCLRENTTSYEVLRFTGTDPADLTQKETDAVMATSPAMWDEWGLNETQRERITDWQMWSNFGQEPDWYDDENATATPTAAPTSTPTSSSPTPSPTEQATATPTEIPASPGESMEGDARRLDEQVIMADWSYSDGTFTIHFNHSGERPKTITMSESGQPEEGAYTFAIQDERLLPGQSTVQITSQIRAGESAVGITSPASRDAGQGILISTGQQGNNPFRYFGGTSGLLSGVLMTVGLAGGAAYWVVRQESAGVEKA